MNYGLWPAKQIKYQSELMHLTVLQYKGNDFILVFNSMGPTEMVGFKSSISCSKVA